MGKWKMKPCFDEKDMEMRLVFIESLYSRLVEEWTNYMKDLRYEIVFETEED